MTKILKSEVFENVHAPWLTLLSHQKSGIDNVLKRLNELKLEQDKFCPQVYDWFSFARITPFNKLKVVIIGQDPYPNNTAHGLAFSCLRGIPPSLQNVYSAIFDQEELKYINDNKQGNLISWAKQGVLLLNASLTTEVNKSNAHSAIWKHYTEYIITKLCKKFKKNEKKLIFILWGAFAHKYMRLIQPHEHYVLMWGHPSPLNQNRLSHDKKFLNCTNFSEANVLLNKHQNHAINWKSVLPTPECAEQSDAKQSEAAEPEAAEPEADKQNKNSDFLKTLEITLQNAILPIKDNTYQTDNVLIFTDGSCINNGKSNALAGLSSICINNNRKHIILGNLSNTHATPSNIRAEGFAILTGLNYIYTSNEFLNIQSNIIIITDSQFWQNMIFRFMPKWSETDFNDHANTDLTKKIWKAWNETKTLYPNIDIEFMRGHNKDGWKQKPNCSYEKTKYDYNNIADILASWSTKNVQSGQIIEFDIS